MEIVRFGIEIGEGAKMKKSQSYSFLILAVGILAITACATTSAPDQKEIFKKSQVSKNIDGSVQSINKNTAEIIANILESDYSKLPFVERVAQRIINRSSLIETDEVLIGNQKAKIIEIRRNLVTTLFEELPKIKVGDKITITFPKHVIAITDFDVIRGHDKSIGIVSLESLTTAIVESGQFNVVERQKINTVLKELQFGSSGLADAQNASKLGKLLNADIILTGTFADMSGSWNVNLRLINVSTGVIVAAFEDKVSFKEIKPEAVSTPPSVSDPRGINREGRFIAYDNGTVLDTETNLIWASKDNGDGINWSNAKSYCENYRGGGYTDWRMPTQHELARLYDSSKRYRATQRDYYVRLTELVQLSACCPWASEVHGSNAALFNFNTGSAYGTLQSSDYNVRALPVRSIK